MRAARRGSGHCRSHVRHAGEREFGTHYSLQAPAVASPSRSPRRRRTWERSSLPGATDPGTPRSDLRQPRWCLAGGDTRNVNGGGPALAHEVEPGNELVSPTRRDVLAGRVAGGMIIEAALGAALGVTAGPHDHVHGRRQIVPRHRRAGRGIAAGRAGLRHLLFRAPKQRRGCPIHDDWTPGG